MGCFNPELLWPKKSKNDPLSGPYEARQPTIYPSSRIPLEALCNLASPDSPASWSHGVAKWAQGTICIPLQGDEGGN